MSNCGFGVGPIIGARHSKLKEMDTATIDAPVRTSGRPVGARDRGQRMSRKVLAERLARLLQDHSAGGFGARVLNALGNERWFLELVSRAESDRDTRTLIELGKFLVQMRDGRPAQQINVTSFGVQVTTSEIESARAIARSLRGDTIRPVSKPDDVPNDGASHRLMLSGDDGGNKGG